jgi:uncharacterized protein (UPF0332 family)/predicted nucleotidyltransferase
MSNAKKSTKKKIKNKSSDNINKLKKPAKSKIKKEAIPKYEIATKTNDENVRLDSLTANLPADLPKEARDKLEKIKTVLDKYQKKIVSKFQGYIMGVSLLPPNQPEQGKELTQEEKDAINVLVLLDDVDSKKMTKEALREKLSTIMVKTAEETDKLLKIETLLITDLWQACADGKYEVLKKIALSAPVFDRGMLSAIKISEIHKQMVLEKFEQYIVSYCLAGSLVQGKAHSKSDIDVFIVIDDTDVKKMSRAELRDKLRAIIIGMGIDAGNMTGIKNKLNIQVYILTDFWDSIKEANPVIFTMLRDGIPLFDKGIFMPWKQLLQMGKIKPSPEAIDMYIHSGDQLLERVKVKFKEIGMEDFFWATLTPSQAALMMFGVAPPTPNESAKVMNDIFVKKEKLLEPEYVAILKKVIDTRKKMEHGEKTTFTGKEADELLKLSEKYLKRLKKLFQQIGELKEGEAVTNAYNSLITIMRDILRLEKDIKTVSSKDILKSFKDNIVHAGLITEKVFSDIKKVFDTKTTSDKKKLTRHEVSETIKAGKEAIRSLVELVERKKSRELDKIKIKVKYGKKFGEVILLGNKVFILHDLEARDKVSKADISKDGRFLKYKDSSLEEMEKELVKIKLPKKSFIKEKIFEDLKSIFGKDVEILLNN